MLGLVAEIALSGATYAFDKLYTYAVPTELHKKAVAGCRVLIPFGRGNTKKQGIIFRIKEAELKGLKNILSVIDDKPILSDELIKLCEYLKESVFCTYYDAVHIMLPAGLNYRLVNFYSANTEFSQVTLLSDDEADVYNYLIKNEYYAFESDGINDYDLRYDIKPYYLFHLDNDGIPEIFVEGLYAADGARILYYSKDNVYEHQLLAGFSSFAPEKGILLDSYGKMESYVDTILQLKDGKVKIIGEGNFSFNIDEDVNPVLDANGNIIYLEGSQWNDIAVSDSGQYNELYNITLSEFNIDKDECRSCIDAEFFIGDIDCMLFALSE